MFEKIVEGIRNIKQWRTGIKASVAYAGVSIFQASLSFITSPIFTRLLTQDEYGQVAIYFSINQLIGTFALFNLGAGCMDIGLQDNEDDRLVFIFSILVLSNITTIATGVLIYFFWPIIKSYIGIDFILMIVMFISFFLSPAYSFWLRLERFEFRYKLSSLITLLSVFLSCACSIIAVLIYKESKVHARVMGASIPLLIIYVIFYFRLGYKVKFKLKKEYLTFAFRFNLPLLPHYLSSYFLGSSDRLMISVLQGYEQAAYYSFAYNFVSIGTIVWTSINYSLVPFVLEQYKRENYKHVSDKVLLILYFIFIILVIIMLFAPELVLLLGTKAYYQAIYVIPPVVASVFFQCLYGIFTNVLYYVKKPKYVLYASLCSGFVNIILNFFLIQRFGYIAAAYTTIFSYALQALLDYIISKRIMGKEIYDIKKILLLSISIVIASILISLLYSNNAVRYIIIFCVIVLFCLYFRRYRKQLFRMGDI